MARMTPAQAAEKWKNHTAAATTDWERGVDNVTVSPGQQAAASVDKWAANTAAAKSKFVQNAGAVSLQDWKTKAKAKSSRYSQGTEQAVPKMQAFLSDFLPKQEQVTQATKAMPSTTPEQREQRMISQMRGTRALRRAR